MRTKHMGVGGVLRVVAVATLGAAAACGTSFDGDCKASRTCAGVGGLADGGAAAQGNETGGASDTAPNGGTPASGGTATNGGAGTNGGTQSGAGSVDVNGGAGGVADPGCLDPADCTDGDPANGEEVCDPDGACQPGNPPPTVTGISPADQAKNADPHGVVVITFSEPLEPATVTAANIKVFDGDTELAGSLEYADGNVTFTPAVPLFLLEAYKVSVSTDVTDVDGVPLLDAYASTFTTRDGAWTTIDAVEGSLTELADSLPLSATGNVLLAWNVFSGAGCPTSARWFRLAAANGAVQPFDGNVTDCYGVTAGGNTPGVASVAWGVPDATHGVMAQQFRAGAWLAKPAVVSKNTSLGQFRVGVSPTGMVTLIAQDTAGGTTAWRTDVNGKWVAAGDTLSSDKPSSPASIAFDASGNGVAVWLAESASQKPEILSSKYTTTSGKWSTATAIPTSVNYGLGAPEVAMSSDGIALAAWTQYNGANYLVNTNIFSQIDGWAAAPLIGASNSFENPPSPAPAVAFDGQGFVVAWVAQLHDAPAPCVDVNCTYTNRYDLKLAKWGSVGARQAAAADIAAAKMPVLASDGGGNLLLVWAKPNGSNTFTLAYQRYVNGKWSATAAVPGGTVTNKNFLTGGVRTPLSMNASGMAALSWGNYDNIGLITTIRLASFF